MNLGNPGRPNFDQLAKAKPDIIFASFRQAHTKTLDEMKKLPQMLKFYLSVQIMTIILNLLKHIQH